MNKEAHRLTFIIMGLGASLLGNKLVKKGNR